MGSTAITELYSGQVLLLATKPLWTDYVSAFGAAVGILVAAGAFVVALRSARDSRRSADAAETTAASAHEQLVLARAEHEQLEADRRRRPIIERIHVGAIASGPGEEDPPAGVFSIGLTNTGDRDLQDAVLTILFDRASAAQLTNRWGQPDLDQSRDATQEGWPGVEGPPESFYFFARPITVQAGVSFVQYVRIPRAGRFPIRVKLFHATLDRRGAWTDRWIEVVDPTGKTTVIDIGQGRRDGPYDGRNADFDPPAAQ
jgi:hypothetical protein